VTVHILFTKFVYNCVFQKKGKKSWNLSQSFHILKMKTHFENESTPWKKKSELVLKNLPTKKEIIYEYVCVAAQAKNENQPCPKISITD